MTVSFHNTPEPSGVWRFVSGAQSSGFEQGAARAPAPPHEVPAPRERAAPPPRIVPRRRGNPPPPPAHRREAGGHQALLWLAGNASLSRVRRFLAAVAVVIVPGHTRAISVGFDGDVHRCRCTGRRMSPGALRAHSVRVGDAEQQRRQPQHAQRPRGSAGPLQAGAQPGRDHAVILAAARRRNATPKRTAC